MKILQINSVYGYGSTGRITRDIHIALRERGHQSFVIYGRGDNTKEKDVIRFSDDWLAKLNNLFSRISGIMYGGCYYSTFMIIRRIKRLKPDIVHIQCINGYFVNIYKLLVFLKKERIPTVITLHAEFMYTGNCGHAYECQKWKTGCGCCPRWKQETKSIFLDRTAYSWRLMNDAYNGFKHIFIVSVSKWLQDRAKESPMLADKNHTVIFNGVDTKYFKPYPEDDLIKLKMRLGLEKENKIAFHATPSFSLDLNSLKGGRYIAELAERCLNEKITFVVAGPHGTGLILPKNIVLLGNIHDKETLAKLYAMSDVTVLTSMRETFSMVCAESLCCGTPVIGFKAGGPEEIAIEGYSYFCEYGNIDEMKSKLMEYMNKKNRNIAVEASVIYSKDRMINDYEKLYNSIITGSIPRSCMDRL